MEAQANRRTFLVGLGRFMLGAAAASIVKPPVLYSFPSEIRVASPAEQAWVYRAEMAAKNVGLPPGWEQVGNMAYTFTINTELFLAK